MGVETTGGIIETIVYRVADEEGVAPDQLEPLYTSIDTDALQDLFDEPSGVRLVEFEYAGYLITVEGGDEVYLESI